jgi:uncharacterized membrane protein
VAARSLMNHDYWYLSRSAGFIAYGLLFSAVALGLDVDTRFTQRFVRRNVVFDIHRFVSILALAFSAFHTYILLGDHYFSYNAWELSVPFWSAPYRAWATAAGIFALWGIGIIVVSFYVRRFIGYRTWRAIHYLTFLAFVAAALHGITSGTDTGELWATAVYVSTIAATLALVLYRVYRVPATDDTRSMRLTAGASAVAVAALVVFPTGLVGLPGLPGDDGSTVATQARATPAPYAFLPRFYDSLRGVYSREQDAAGSHVTVNGTADGDAAMKLDVRLDEGPPDATGAVTVERNEANLLDAVSDAVLCVGTVKTLDRGYLQITCDGRGPYQGNLMRVAALIRANEDGTFSGDLTGNMQHDLNESDQR